uniref:Uncharacterized protein n=1 Tax=Rhizophora mucronata TaxID=61149 RepID=A0A2P2KQ61_RHIMU
MVKATDYIWCCPPHCTWQSPNLNGMNSMLEPLKQGCLSSTANLSPSTCMFSANPAMPGFAKVPCWKMWQRNEVYGLPHYLPPHFQNLLPVANPCPNENLSVFSSGLSVQAAPNTMPQCQKGFIIFDQSGNGMRVLFSPFNSTIPRQTMAATKPIFDYDLQKGKGAAGMEHMNLAKPMLQNVSDEKHLSCEGSEMHEDTEEINALLYSDGDGYDNYSDDDEVTSTGRSPFALGLNYGTQEHVNETTEEVALSDVPNKRQKLRDGGYKKPALADTASSVKVEGPNGYAESIGQIQGEEIVSNLENKQLKKDKIRAKLKFLKSIVPGAKDGDPTVGP